METKRPRIPMLRSVIVQDTNKDASITTVRVRGACGPWCVDDDGGSLAGYTASKSDGILARWLSTEDEKGLPLPYVLPDSGHY